MKGFLLVVIIAMVAVVACKPKTTQVNTESADTIIVAADTVSVDSTLVVTDTITQ